MPYFHKPETTVRHSWESFAKECIPLDAHPSQRAGMQMAFYGGAMSMFDLLAKASALDSEDDEPSVREVATVQMLYDELQAWAERYS